MNGRQSILVVDDTVANLRLLAEILADREFMVRPVPDGALAINAAKADPPDLILLDVMMPNLSGYEVCERLKADERTRDIPVIFISAKNDVLDKVKAFSLGAVDYITKPFQAEEVLARVATHLTLRGLQRRLEEQNQALSDALHQLKVAQDQLIQREKIAALGHLIAGIAHEINTPLGAIRASITNISHALEHSLDYLPRLFQTLSPERQADFLALLQASLAHTIVLSSREARQKRRDMQEQLAAAGIDDAEAAAKLLVNMGIYDDATPFLPLLREEGSIFVLQTAYNLFMQKNNSQNIMFAVDRVSKIVFALKNYMHYEESDQKARAQVTEGIDIVLTLYHNQLKYGIELVTNYAPVPQVECYPDELKQVWTNLIHNAIQAMQGAGRLEIHVYQDRMPPRDPPDERQAVVVQVTDTGHGIAPENLPRIFDPFFTTKAAGEGSGLGLDIVRKILARHQGAITVESQPGNTTFRVFLPV